MKKSLLLALTLLLGTIVQAASGESFFKENDSWLLVGDSITYTNTYSIAVMRILEHFHPNCGITKFNKAVWGAANYIPEKTDKKPSIVTIMLGMNHVIHHEYAHKNKFNPQNFSNYITGMVRKYKKLGCTVVLFTPTLTDERVGSFFSPMYTRDGLLKYGEAIREIGRKEGCIVIPVSEELEAYEDTLGPNELCRTDGVHPYGEAQYRIAYSILQHLNVAGKLTGKREMSPAPVPVPVKVTKAKSFLNSADEKVVLKLKADKAVKFKLTWSLAGERGSQEISLPDKGEMDWPLPATDKAYELSFTEQKQAIVDLQTADNKLSFYIIDLAKTKVVKPVDGKVEMKIVAPAKPAAGDKTFWGDSPAYAGERPEWKAKHEGFGNWFRNLFCPEKEDVIATLKIEEKDDSLWFSGRVYDSELYDKYTPWITDRDCVRIMLDFRPAARFGHLQPDRDTTMVLITPCRKPEFTLETISWWGPRFQYCMYSNGKQNDDGFSWIFGYNGHITNYTKFDIRKLDYYGFNMSYLDKDEKTWKSWKLNSLFVSRFDTCVEHGLNQLIIVDRKNKFPGDTTTTVQCWGM